MHNPEDLYLTKLMMELHGVQARIDKLLRQRNELIVATKGHIGCRRLARWLDMSPAQVSRIQNGQTQAKTTRPRRTQ